MKNENFELLSAALRSIGGNFDVPTLELIFLVNEEIKSKGDHVSIGDIRKVSQKIAQKYGIEKNGEGQRKS